MFDIGFWELSVIGVVALLVVGPDKLPGVAREAGRMVGRAQRMASDLRREFAQEADFQELNKLREAINPDDMEAQARKFQAELAEMSKVDVTAPPYTPAGSGGKSASESGSVADAATAAVAHAASEAELVAGAGSRAESHSAAASDPKPVPGFHSGTQGADDQSAGFVPDAPAEHAAEATPEAAGDAARS